MNPPLDLQLLNRFLDEIQKDKEYIVFKDSRLNSLVSLIDSKEQCWHVHGNELWPIKEWRVNAERIRLRDLALKEHRAKLDRKRELMDQLVCAIERQLLMTNDLAKLVAEKILNAPNPIEQGKYFNVDLSDVPKFDKPHIVIEGRTEYVF